ncbi:NAD-dependent epimerase/dehydratase family protein [Clostridium sp.]|jgi:nucleoside-diphosphate-sugar epimerase|uniref:NAD-dependent epimerase/dehydratase family protein n=1 Tax=Clostridium sp. TaxID=1506 RepID=UPI003EEA84C3
MRKLNNIMLTGSNGFIGSNLLENLSKDYNVYPANRETVNLLDGKSVRSFINKNQIDLIINCANVGGTRKTGYDIGKVDIFQENLKIFFNLVRCLNKDIRLIHFGSGAEYNKNNDLKKIKELDFDKSVPEDSYGYAKYIMSRYIEKEENINCLRIFGCYGPHEDYTFKFISNSIIKNIMNLPITINQNVVFDYLFIDDLVSIVRQFIINQPKDKIMNITPTKSIDLLKVARIINEIGDNKSEIILLKHNLNKEYTGDNSLLFKYLKDFNFTSYEIGIRKLYDYYVKNIDKIEIKTIKNDLYIKNCKTVL